MFTFEPEKFAIPSMLESCASNRECEIGHVKLIHSSMCSSCVQAEFKLSSI